MKPTSDTAKRCISIRAKIFLSLLCIIIVALALLWFFQVSIFEVIYNNVRINEIVSTAKHAKLFCDDTAFYSQLSQATGKTVLCAQVLSADGTVVFSVENTNACLIHSLTATEREELISFINGQESKMFAVTYDGAKDKYDLSELSVARFISADNVIYLSAISHNGETLYLLLDGVISPVSTVTKTSASFLIMLSLVLVPLAILLANLLSKLIANPIAEISEQAGSLSSGEYTPVKSNTEEIAELNESLTRAAHDLKQVGHLRQELIANISHDLRTPLTLMSGYLEMMRDFPDEITEENLQTAIDECNRLSSLVSDMMDIARLENGVVKPNPAPFCLTDSIEKTVARYSEFAAHDGYTLSFTPETRVNVNADETLILQVFTNLLNNALTYTGDDKQITVVQLVQNGNVRIEVVDTGDGIDPEKLPLIWDRYYKADTAHKRAARGTGLGLSIVRNVINLHGGTYGVRSLPGKGSAFWFELPCQPPSDEEASS